MFLPRPCRSYKKTQQLLLCSSSALNNDVHRPTLLFSYNTWDTQMLNHSRLMAASNIYLIFHFLILPQSFPVVKNSPANSRDVGSIPGMGRFPWRRKWQPTPVFLPGKSHGQRSLVDYSPWSCKQSDTTKWLSTHSLTTETQLI